jgi:hypothetical protein
MSNSPFIESIRTELRTRHYSIRTEKTYLYVLMISNILKRWGIMK